MPAHERFPEILPPACPPTHFTVEEARRAVLEVLDEDRRARRARHATRPRVGARPRGRSTV